MVNDWQDLVEQVVSLQEDPETDSAPGPSFQWYADRWLSDPKVMLMSFEARGVHIHLLNLAWKGFALEGDAIPGSIPSDPEVLRAICQRPARWDEIWPEVSRAWKDHRGRLWNLGLCRSYLSQMDHRQRRQRAGQKAAKARWGAGAKQDRGKNAKPGAGTKARKATKACDSHRDRNTEPCDSDGRTEAVASDSDGRTEATASDSQDRSVAVASDSHAIATEGGASNHAIGPRETLPLSPSPSPSVSPLVGEERETASDPSSAPPDIQVTPSDVDSLSIPKRDRLGVARLLAEPERIDMVEHRASKLTDEKAARRERSHLLAHLVRSTATEIEQRVARGGSSDSALDLWNLWRQQRKAKVKAERRPWFSEVQTLRKLLDGEHSPSEVVDALLAAGTAGWQGFEWAWVNGSNAANAHTGERPTTGAAGFLPSEADGIDV